MSARAASALLIALLCACGADIESAGRAGLLRDIAPGAESSYPYSFVPLGGIVVFTASQRETGTEVWTTDGTAAGTVMLNPDRERVGGTFREPGPSWLTRVGPRVFFAASDDDHGSELWVTDGTTAGTRLVKDINPGPERPLNTGGSSYPRRITDVDGIAYFTACDEEYGAEVWRSDGTAAGTWRVTDVVPGPGPRVSPDASACFEADWPAFLTARGGVLYFVAGHPESGHEVWRTDGTAPGTRLVKDADPGPDPPRSQRTIPDTARDLTVANGLLFFASRSGLWKSDGTEAGTVLVSPAWARMLTSTGHLLFFAGPGGDGNGTLWRSDGSASGTFPVTEATLGTDLRFQNNLSEMQPVGDRVYFDARTAGAGWELWTSDGSRAGTRLVSDLRPGSPGSDPYALTGIGNALAFAADDGGGQHQLWVASEHVIGRLTDVERGVQTESEAFRPVHAMTRFGNLLLFAGETRAEGVELWAYRFTN